MHAFQEQPSVTRTTSDRYWSGGRMPTGPQTARKRSASASSAAERHGGDQRSGDPAPRRRGARRRTPWAVIASSAAMASARAASTTAVPSVGRETLGGRAARRPSPRASAAARRRARAGSCRSRARARTAVPRDPTTTRACRRPRAPSRPRRRAAWPAGHPKGRASRGCLPQLDLIMARGNPGVRGAAGMIPPEWGTGP